MHMKKTILAGCSALILAGSAVGAAGAAGPTPTTPAGSTEVSGTIVWHETVGRFSSPANVGVLLDVSGSDILVNIPRGTPMYRKYWGTSDPTELNNGDTLNAWGTYQPSSDSLVLVAQMAQAPSIQDAEAEATGKVLFKDDGFVMVKVSSKPAGSPIGTVLVGSAKSTVENRLAGGLARSME